MSDQIEVMVLDDEEVVGERLADYLTKRGMSVETFTSSRQALDRLKEKTFDVIVSDIKMEGPTGIDVLVSVKQAASPSEVILITGYGTLETLRASEAVGGFAYVLKPFKAEDIHKQVVKAARRARRNAKQAPSESE